MIKKIFALFIIISFQYYGQIFEPPIPNCDIDSLVKSVNLLEFYKRANVEMALKLSIDIDSSGNTKEINYYPFFKDSLSTTDKKFIIELLPKLNSIQWTPAKNDGENINITYTIPIIFFSITDQSTYDKYLSEKRDNKKSNVTISLTNRDFSKPILIINKSAITYSATWN